MSGTKWAKFYWSDWASDPALRLCDLAAQGLWMRMLCVAAEHDPCGYVAIAGRPLGVTDLARLAGVDETEAGRLLDNLAVNGVFSRDRHGRIYSRRMVRDARNQKKAAQSGRKGGELSRDNQRGIFRPSEGPPRVPSHPEAISQIPERKKAAASRPELDAARPPPQPPADALLDRAATELGVNLAQIRKNLAWINFPGFVAEWRRQGAIDDDIWPTLRRIRAKKGDVPNSPAYFAAAVIEAKDRRLAEQNYSAATQAAEANLPPDHPQIRARVAHFRKTGEWFENWGKRPTEAA